MSVNSVKHVPLFGEHMSIYLPADAKDISDVRQVPDNQEVFSHPTTDQSIIIEILEYVNEPDEQALRTHYEDLATSNGAQGPQDSQVMGIEPIPCDQLSMPECTAAYLLTAQQMVAKYNESAKNTLQLFMGLFRLPDFESDILVTLNDPIHISLQSSSHKAVPVGAEPWTVEHFKQALLSFKIHNTAIFGC